MQKNVFNPIQSAIVPLQGTEITTADSGWYIAQIDLSPYIPSGAVPIGIETISFDGNIIPVLNINTNTGVSYLTLRSPVSKTITSAYRRVMVFYSFVDINS